jgi:hypothetical protein
MELLHNKLEQGVDVLEIHKDREYFQYNHSTVNISNTLTVPSIYPKLP